MASVVDKRDLSNPAIRRKALSVSNDGSLATAVRFGDLSGIPFDEPAAHGGSGWRPATLAGVLAAPHRCEAVTFGRAAREMGFECEGVRFDAAVTIDIRGRSGMRRAVPHFQTVKVATSVRIRESEARLRNVVEETEAPRPLFSSIKDAGVRIEMAWIRDAGDVDAMAA